jgi:hypothetical protein
MCAQATKQVNALMEATQARIAAIHSDADKTSDFKAMLQKLAATM